MKEINEIRELIKEAFEDKVSDDLVGLYNYIRYANEDFGDDMIINNAKPLCDNSEIQHIYLVLFINESIDRQNKIPENFLKLFKENNECYQNSLIGKEIVNIEKYISTMH